MLDDMARDAIKRGATVQGRIADLEAEVARLRAKANALGVYVEHLAGCPKHLSDEERREQAHQSNRCQCGLDALLGLPDDASTPGYYD